jgi:hypothetical protein
MAVRASLRRIATARLGLPSRRLSRSISTRRSVAATHQHGTVTSAQRLFAPQVSLPHPAYARRVGVEVVYGLSAKAGAPCITCIYEPAQTLPQRRILNAYPSSLAPHLPRDAQMIAAEQLP